MQIKSPHSSKVAFPVLRFPEFSDKWEMKKLSTLVQEYKEQVSAPTILPVYTSSRTGLRPQKEYYNNRELQNEGYYGVVPRGFFTYRHMSDDMTFKFNLNIYEDKIAVSKEYPVFKVIGTDPYFLLYKLNESSDFKRFAIMQKKGGTRTRLYFKVLGGWNTLFPTLAEQQKIASFISTIDVWIENLKLQKLALEKYKKEIMQKIFYQEIRFKDEQGKDFPDWEEKKIGDVGVLISGLTYSPNNIHKSGTLVLRSSNIDNRQLVFSDNVYVNLKVGDFNPVMENDILICVRNGSKKLIGKNALINKATSGVAFGAFMAVYRSKYNSFLFHYFDSMLYKKEVHKNLGATINSINGSDLKKFKVPFPSTGEQEKIATYLTALDKLLALTNLKIIKVREWKEGLIQQLFV